MSSSLGFFASQISGHLSNPAYEAIASTIMGGTLTSYTFSSIPSTYKHLEIRFAAITSSGGANIGLQLNGDSSSSYYYSQGYGDGSAYGIGASVNNYLFGPYQSTTVGSGVFRIVDYLSSLTKTSHSYGGDDKNGSGYTGFQSSMWNNTSAITSVTVMLSGGQFLVGTYLGLYGIKES